MKVMRYLYLSFLFFISVRKLMRNDVINKGFAYKGEQLMIRRSSPDRENSYKLDEFLIFKKTLKNQQNSPPTSTLLNSRSPNHPHTAIHKHFHINISFHQWFSAFCNCGLNPCIDLSARRTWAFNIFRVSCL